MILLCGPQKHEMVLKHGINSNMYICEFNCISLEYSNALFKIDYLRIENIENECVKLSYELQNNDHDCIISDIIYSKNLPCNVEFSDLTPLSGLLCFRDLLNPIIKLKLISIDDENETIIGEYNLSITEETNELNFQDQIYNEIDNSSYFFEFNGSITGFPKYIQCFEGTDTFSRGIHHFNDIVIPDNHISPTDRYSKMEVFELLCYPIATEPTKTIYPFICSIECYNIQYEIKDCNVDDLSVIFYINNISTGLIPLNSIKNIRIPTYSTFTPFLFTKEYLNFEIYSLNGSDYLGGNRISLHNLFSGPDYYSMKLKSNNDLRLSFNIKTNIKKTVIANIHEIYIENINDQENFSIKFDINGESQTEKLINPINVNINYDSTETVFKHKYKISLMKDEILYAEYKGLISDLLPFTEDKEMELILPLKSDKNKTSIFL